jgi:RNA ligase
MKLDPRISDAIDIPLLQDHATLRARSPPSRKKWALIKSTLHPHLPIAIHNYTQDVPSHNVWDPLTLAARTLVTETETGAVVSRSFSKFFNHHEPLAYKPTGDETAVIVEEKVDGSIVSLFWYAGEWHAISKSQFEGPFVHLANEILRNKYAGASEKLDKEKTYVFELINPSQPIGVKYIQQDMVLLSIVSKDAREAPPDFDWSKLPFTRPRELDTRTVNLDELRAMNPVNEEGFVVKFYPSQGDMILRPQRVKVKFDSYLALVKTRYNVSPAGILKLYIKSRGAISELKEAIVRERMTVARDKYIQSLQPLADDFGGDAWLQQVEDAWSRIDRYFIGKEREWQRVVAVLKAEGYPGPNSRENTQKKRFSARIRQGDVDAGLREVLHNWYAGASIRHQIRCFAGTLPVSDELKQSEALGDRKFEMTVTSWK